MIDKVEIIRCFNNGQENTKELAEQFGCSQRYVQMVIEDSVPLLKKYGRTKSMKIFSVMDVYKCMQSNELTHTLVNKRYKEYYIKNNSKLLSYQPINVQSKRNILRGRVLERDEFMCVDCGSSVALEVHHLRPVKDFPDLEFDLGNCVCLCRCCHRGVPCL